MSSDRSNLPVRFVPYLNRRASCPFGWARLHGQARTIWFARSRRSDPARARATGSRPVLGLEDGLTSVHEGFARTCSPLSYSRPLHVMGDLASGGLAGDPGGGGAFDATRSRSG
jgi:hypothetical protein